MKKISLLLLVVVLFSNCASILNSKYQKVKITSSRKDKILINGESPKKKKGKVLLKRDFYPKQITVKRDGYKDENTVIMQYRKSPLYLMSWVPFGLIVFMPPLLDRGAKSFDYGKEISVGKNLLAIPERKKDSKEIELNKVSVDIKKENIKYNIFSSYLNFIMYKDKTEAEVNEKAEDIEVENTFFSNALNNILKEKGYIDTTKKVLKNSYLNNLMINSTINDYTYNFVESKRSDLERIDSETFTMQNYGFVFVDLSIKWEALDYYKKVIYSKETKVKSGQFAIEKGKEKKYKSILNNAIEDAIKDAMEEGLIKFLNSKEVETILNDKSEVEKEATQKTIIIPKANEYVSSIPEAIKASVTIKNKDGHGSGFFISEDGYIITNYHVVSDSVGLKVITNDEKEYDVKIIRVSKIYDLALLKVQIKNVKPFKINESKEIMLGDDIFAVGTPTAEDLSQTISKGIISGERKTETNSKLIQTDASINAGNSGGAIISEQSIVLAVVSSKLIGFGIEGVAFGIPAYEILDRLILKIK